MSGRTRHWREGKLITNRKTDRRQAPRVGPDQLPDWLLRVQLPDNLAFSVGVGPTSVRGVAVVLPGPMIEARGKNREWLKLQVEHYLSAIADGIVLEGPIEGVLTRDAYPGLTEGAPWRPSVKRVVQLEVES